MELQEKLKQHRKNTGLTQAEIAQKLKVSRQTISNWETGKSLPDIYSLVTLSEVYDLSLDELIKGDVQVMKNIKKENKVKKIEVRLLACGILGVGLMAFYHLLGSLFNSNAADFINGMGLGLTVFAVVAMVLTPILAKKLTSH